MPSERLQLLRVPHVSILGAHELPERAGEHVVVTQRIDAAIQSGRVATKQRELATERAR
jgi:hypothetical protein